MIRRLACDWDRGAHLRRRFVVLACCVVLVLGCALASFRFALPGLSSARPAPPGIEVRVAGWLLHHSVPAAARAERNPRGRTPRT
jgi:hypothetical protein